MQAIILIFTLLNFVLAIKVINTSFGKVRGITDYSDQNNFKYIFKGVPFAKPPTGNLRFALPQPPDNWNHILDASRYRPACLSNSSLTSTQSDISEDCLYLNIFTSEACLLKKCPVIVYYHGGSFNLDSATMFPDQFILERYVGEGVVFVIPAFRLGAFGQLFFGESEIDVLPSNLLVYDCLRALEFVHEEISKFGGNVNDVTIMGHSSGGSLVDSLGFSTVFDQEMRLFQKMIVLSSHGLYGFVDIQVNNSKELAIRLGCSLHNSTTQEVLGCLRKKDARQILNTQKEMEENDNLFFKAILQAPPLMKMNERIEDLKKNPKPRKMLCGVAEHEFEKFQYNNYYVSGRFLDFENPVEVVMIYRSNYTNSSAALVNSDSSSVFVSAATYSEALVNAGGEVYLFESRQKPYTMHISDMQFFIGIHRESVHTTDMDILDRFYSKMLVNFTKFGEPSPNWQKYDPAKMNFLSLEVDSDRKIEPRMENGFHEELVNFWMIDMFELDQNITEQKKNGNLPVGFLPTEKSISTSASVAVSTINSPTTTTINVPKTNETEEFSTLSPISENYAIYQQWWFPVLILLALLVLIFVFLILKKHINTEYEPI